MVEIDKTLPAVAFEKVSFSYPAQAGASATPVIDHASFSVASGAFCLITGATGAGKTTLLRLIKPELAPAGLHEGCIRVFGKDIKKLSVIESASLIGFVGQAGEARCVCDTVVRELAFGLENLGVETHEMRRRVAETCYFLGIEKLLHKQCSELSGGERQLVELAAVLVMEPQLLVLDEPTASLDPLARADFAHALFRLNRELGITILASTHEPWTMTHYATQSLAVKDCCLAAQPLNEIAREPKLPSLSDLLAENESNKDKGSELDVAHQLQKRACGGIFARGVWQRYEKNAPWVLRDLSYEVGSGTVGVLIGGNGSGKSTLLAALAGVRSISRGRIGHVDAPNWSNSLLARKPSCQSRLFVPQDPEALFSCATVSEELGAWAHAIGDKKELLQHVRAWAQRLGIEKLLSRDPFELSRGQRQLVALGKVFLPNPDLLILDEPTSGLDMAGKQRVARSIAERRKHGRTTIIATHDLAFARALANNISLMFDGSLACTMPPEAFFSRNVFFR